MANLILDRHQQRVVLIGMECSLTDLEFEVLWVLSAFTGIPLTLDRLTGHLHDNDVETDIQQLHPCLLALQQKLPLPRRLGMTNDRVILS